MTTLVALTSNENLTAQGIMAESIQPPSGLTKENTIIEEALATTSLVANENVQPNDVHHCPEDEENEEETDLTNLTWLTELRNQSITWPNAMNIAIEDDEKFCERKVTTAPVQNADNVGKQKHVKTTRPKTSTCSGSNSGCSSKSSVQTPTTTAKHPTPAERFNIFLEKIKRDLAEYEQSAASYQTDAAIKPPYNYSHIIGMAMLQNGRVTLQQICSYIESKFAFFRVRKKWNNSIRHNLSLHHCFRKIDRNKYEKGKGGYWELGVDPKKCDRKRIRNRKSNRNKTKVPSTTNVTEIVQQSEEIISGDILTSTVEGDFIVNHHIDASNQYTNLHSDTNEAQQTLYITDILPQTDKAIEISGSQQYHLGTIIISTTAADEICSTGFNLITNSYDCQAPTQDFNTGNHDDETTSTNENVCSGFANPNMVVDDYATLSSTNANTLQNQQSPTMQQLNSHSICSQQQQQQQYKQRPNVIVEQVLPATGGPTTTSTTIGSVCGGAMESNASHFTSASATVMPIMSAANSADFVNAVGDNFRPYIDGIEEAFQYLRSIDQSNREDILDNLLDISVSDY